MRVLLLTSNSFCLFAGAHIISGSCRIVQSSCADVELSKSVSFVLYYCCDCMKNGNCFLLSVVLIFSCFAGEYTVSLQRPLHISTVHFQSIVRDFGATCGAANSPPSRPTQLFLCILKIFLKFVISCFFPYFLLILYNIFHL